MKRTVVFVVVCFTALGAWVLARHQSGQTEGRERSFADLPHSIAAWSPETLGHHRAVVRVAQPATGVLAHIEWRRRDADPEAKDLVVTDAAGQRIRNVVRIAVSREAADIVFEPRAGAGDYYVYYMPNSGEGRANYPKVIYPRFQETADGTWIAHTVGPDFPAGAPPARPSQKPRADIEGTGRGWQSLPRAEVVAWQSRSELDAFSPMEFIATQDEVSRLTASRPEPFLLFTEDRRYPIRMTDDLPYRWIQAGPGRAFRGEAARGEFYTFQVGIFAARQPVRITDVRLAGLNGPGGTAVGAQSFRCINLGGTDSAGTRFTKTVAVEQGKVQALWCGLQVPENTQPGTYRGTLTVSAQGGIETATLHTARTLTSSVDIVLTVRSSSIVAAGDDEPWRHARLRWLDSTLAQDDEVVRPYTPVTVRGRALGVLGRRIVLGTEGFPNRIESYFAPEMTRITALPRQVLASPIAFTVRDAGGTSMPLKWTAAPVFTKQAPGAVAWETRATDSATTLRMTVRGQVEMDGTVDYRVALAADRPVALGDVRLEIPVARDVAKYMMGMGLKGGFRPATFTWKWDVQRNQDSAWIGDVNAGLQFSMRDERYVRPLNTNFYQLKPLVMPRSWDNGGKGGCSFGELGEAFAARCFSGPRTLQAGETVHYDFRLLVTPFHALDTRAQWTTRYFHAFKPLDEVAATGANTLNIHHANDINPYINYPFLRPAEMKAYIDEAHRRGYKVKIYYTVRELSNRAPEVFALRSLGEEVLIGGPGGGPSWLQEHLGGNYIAGWYVPALRDAAIVTSGVSRWHNYYVEGLDWLVRNVGIDGLYIDDVAFDRTTMKRVRKVLGRGRPGSLIDLHSANQFNIRDGFANSANLYLEHFPYLDRLWFGEYFDYNSAPDFWIVEMAGIPFGLMGEMLQDGGNPWRGMIYGMTNRLPWTSNSDPRPLWKLWDEFGIEDTEMLGYWAPNAPVRTGREDVLATTYVKRGRALVSIASWAKERTEVALQIDWKRLGLDPSKVSISAPAVEKFQDARTLKVGEPVPVEPGKGWLLVIK